MNAKKNTILILSIDGGGIRGIIPCILLKHLAWKLNQANIHTPLYNIFDIMAGTSTGALITSILANPLYSHLSNDEIINMLIDLYTKEGKYIFPKPHNQYLSYVKQLFMPKYSNKYLKKLLERYLQDSTLKSSMTNVIIPVLKLNTIQPYFFKNRSTHKKYTLDPDFYYHDIALAASATSTYFPPVFVTPIGSDCKHCLVDGGVFANNPSLCAYIESKKIYPNASKVILVSLGTGDTQTEINCKNPNYWGLLNWLNPKENVPILSALLNSQPIATNHMLENLPYVDFFRFNIIIGKKSASMDNASKDNINDLIKVAKRTIRYYDKKMDVLVEEIKQANV